MYFQTKIIPQATEPAKLAHRPQMFFFLGNIQRFQYHILESGNEWSRISNRRHHAKALDAPLFCVHSAVNINFVQSFNMFGHKLNWHPENLLKPFGADPLHGAKKCRLEPFGRTDSALVTK